MSQGLYCLLLSQLRAFLCDLRALLWDNKDPIQSCAFHGFMLIRPLNLRLSGNHPELTTTIGPWVTRRPSNQGSKEVRFSLWLRGKKFRSRIRFLQLSTGKVTPYGHVLYQFGETSYRVSCFLFVGFSWRNQSGDHLPSSHVGSSRPLEPQLSLGRGTWPHAGDRLYSPMANGNDPFPTHSGLQLVWREVHSYRKHRFGN